MTASDGGNPDGAEGAGTPPGAPRWVKAVAVVVGVLAVLLIVAKVTGLGGEHGPGRHLSGLEALTAAVGGLG
jgi:hypothetical protein